MNLRRQSWRNKKLKYRSKITGNKISCIKRKTNTGINKRRDEYIKKVNKNNKREREKEEKKKIVKEMKITWNKKGKETQK